MTDTVQFNIGGTPYKVSRSLIESHPDSMLAKSVSEQWQEDPEAEVFIDRDSSRFRYVLDYMRDGKVVLPVTESKESVLAELQYYGIESNETDVDDTNARLVIPPFIEYLRELKTLEISAGGAIAILEIYLAKSLSTQNELKSISLVESTDPKAFKAMAKVCNLDRIEALKRINEHLQPVGLNVGTFDKNYNSYEVVFTKFSFRPSS